MTWKSGFPVFRNGASAIKYHRAPSVPTARLAGTRTLSIQRRDLRHLQRPEEYRAIDKAQRKRPRRSALQGGLLAERIDARNNADARILAHDLAEARNRPVQRAHQVVDVLGLHPRRQPIEPRLRYTLLQHFVDAERRNHLLDPGHRHLQLTVETAARAEAQRTARSGDQVTLLNAGLEDLDASARRLNFPKPLRPWLW